eukprot:Gb_21800 [translate_table: standard]
MQEINLKSEYIGLSKEANKSASSLPDIVLGGLSVAAQAYLAQVGVKSGHLNEPKKYREKKIAMVAGVKHAEGVCDWVEVNSKDDSVCIGECHSHRSTSFSFLYQILPLFIVHFIRLFTCSVQTNPSSSTQSCKHTWIWVSHISTRGEEKTIVPTSPTNLASFWSNSRTQCTPTDGNESISIGDSMKEYPFHETPSSKGSHVGVMVYVTLPLNTVNMNAMLKATNVNAENGEIDESEKCCMQDEGGKCHCKCNRKQKQTLNGCETPKKNVAPAESKLHEANEDTTDGEQDRRSPKTKQ